MRVYYNEFDPYAAQWLRNLIGAGLIPAGDVDERSIREVQPEDLRGYAQCHFFAGIAGWSLALELAGWPATRHVWTGSCPCQPFSAAGKRKGSDDPRHLWPDFLRLITARNPPTVFGEQVASKDGRVWLAGVRTDLEALAYDFGAADLCAAGVGAPHIRQRLFWVADATGSRRIGPIAEPKSETRDEARLFMSGSDCAIGAERLADADGWNASAERQQRSGQQRQFAENSGAADGVEHAARDGREQRRPEPVGRSVESRCGVSGLGEPAREQVGLPGFPWRQSDTVDCADGKTRRIEPGTFPLAHGVSNRVGKLRAYGNAIVPQTAAQFISAYMEAA